jgi:hypothetical protein
MGFFTLVLMSQIGDFCGIRDGFMGFGWDINAIMWMLGFAGTIGLGFIEVRR